MIRKILGLPGFVFSRIGRAIDFILYVGWGYTRIPKKTLQDIMILEQSLKQIKGSILTNTFLKNDANLTKNISNTLMRK